MHSSLLAVFLGVFPAVFAQDGPVDPGIANDCTYWDTSVDASSDCGYFESTWFISHADFVDWNPSVKQDCSGIKIGHSYCVEVNNGNPRTTSKDGSTPTTTTTTTKPTGTPKPSPTQDGLIDSCVNFYFAKSGDTCSKIVNEYGTFTVADFVKWNPAVGQGCTGLWANTYYCVGIPGTPTAKPTTTSSQAPVDTCNPDAPQPTQAGIVCHCNKWHYVKGSGATCDDVINYEKISADNFYKWNPAVGRDCRGLWQGYNVCVGVPGSSPVTTTTTPVETCNPSAPLPTQTGIVCHCNKWHYVRSSTATCQEVINFEKISADDFYKWNPAVGRDCRGLWQGYNVCVGVPGSTPVTTAQKPVETCNPGAPQPVQPGAVCHCKKWHYVRSKTATCDEIIKFEKISASNFYKWNPKVGRDCTGLWQGYNVCVGV